MASEPSNLDQKTEDPEGLDVTDYFGWGEYPLDSVFVRKEQRSVAEIIKRIKANRYILNPDFQRDFVWPLKKQSRLIESCLMRIPLPVFYVAEANDGRIVVVDGLQRLTTFIRYLNDEFSLTKLGDNSEDTVYKNPLHGKRFSDLSINLQERLEDTQLTLYILDSKAPDRAKLDIFERVNSGEPLARQQMRNCLFNGQATKWLKWASERKEFVDATGESLDRKSMRDREAINRFCAFLIMGYGKYKGDMDDFLAESLEIMNKMSNENLMKLKDLFLTSMKINYKLFGRHAFRKSLAVNKQNAQRSIINISLFDVCSVFFAKNSKILDNVQESLIRSRMSKLLTYYDFAQSISYSTNGRRQVSTRFEMMKYLLSSENDK